MKNVTSNAVALTVLTSSLFSSFSALADSKPCVRDVVIKNETKKTLNHVTVTHRIATKPDEGELISASNLKRNITSPPIEILSFKGVDDVWNISWYDQTIVGFYLNLSCPIFELECGEDDGPIIISVVDKDLSGVSIRRNQKYACNYHSDHNMMKIRRR